MYYSSANWARASRIVYGCQKTKDMVKKRYYEGINDIEVLNKNNTFCIKFDYILDFEEEIINMPKEWEKKAGIV